QTELFVQRFGEIRTKMANIALLAKREKWSDLQRQTKSLEDFAVSLSPVYGRVDYVQNLIKQGEMESARKELEILKTRLNNLSWTMAQLE
ncbi:type VI secretion protein, partial [Vibrio fluvialis]|nr:type VI secretion protein [Vibrio fluvialis]